MRYLLSFLLCMMMSFSAFGIGVDEKPLPEPAAEARAQELMKQLRCLVCQNQSIVDSNADLAKDLRVIVRQRIIAGDTDQQVIEFMTSRYGDWVLLKPPFDGATIILWLSPFLLLLIGFVIIYQNQKRNSENLSPDPLSKDEKARLLVLLDEKENV